MEHNDTKARSFQEFFYDGLRVFVPLCLIKYKSAFFSFISFTSCKLLIIFRLQMKLQFHLSFTSVTL